MRVQTEEWRRFIPGMGIRMYKGKNTLFYNGEIIWDDENREWLIYNQEEQESWEVIIVLPGVELIPEETFCSCQKLETVIMSDTVRRIERLAFADCKSLIFIRLSRNLEYIGNSALWECKCLPSIFIPPSCQEIDDRAFADCHKLIIFHVPRHTQLGENMIANNALISVSSFDIDEYGDYDTSINENENVNEWIKNINGDDEQYALHRSCSSFNPITDVLYRIVKRQGLASFRRRTR